MIQLDLFEKDELMAMLTQLAEIRKSSENVRRGIFARHNELEKKFIDLETKVVKMESVGAK